ncbi:hypothetical protein [Streptomyces sp. NBC_00989]|uniref:hypothetical protein n=1 Tax=Streptomyces sp. NBC_00989 TaxID=2903705 RepID=UPI00386FF704|nr:hypothetical protein OG714_21030 [Streptomyces sp. NBC_00989]
MRRTSGDRIDTLAGIPRRFFPQPVFAPNAAFAYAAPTPPFSPGAPAAPAASSAYPSRTACRCG